MDDRAKIYTVELVSSSTFNQKFSCDAKIFLIYFCEHYWKKWGRNKQWFHGQDIKDRFLLFYNLGALTKELWIIWPSRFGLYPRVRQAAAITASIRRAG